MKHLAIFVVASIAATACDSSKAGAANAAAPAASSSAGVPDNKVAESRRRVTVSVTASGYEPSTVQAAAGEPLTLVFKRTTDQTCGQEVVFPDRDIRRSLPLNEEVEVELTAPANETIAFTCGMGMYRGSVVAAAR
jgi:plastocyanin domain-containing protein